MYANVYIIFQASMLEYDAGTYSSTLGAANAIDTCVCVCVCVCLFLHSSNHTISEQLQTRNSKNKIPEVRICFPKKTYPE